MIVVCTDVTHTIDLERQGIKLRSQFFASIAHELRTPLNSIIPILKLILSILTSIIQENPEIKRSIRLLQIVMNSSTHLSNVINDALDITRIENNKFELILSVFSIRNTLKEVADVMQF